MSVFFDRIRVVARSLHGFDPNQMTEGQYTNIEIEGRVGEFLGKQSITTAVCVVMHHTAVSSQDLPLGLPESEKDDRWPSIYTRTCNTHTGMVRSLSSNTSMSSRFLSIGASTQSLLSIPTEESSLQSLSSLRKRPPSFGSKDNNSMGSNSNTYSTGKDTPASAPSGLNKQWTRLSQLLERLHQTKDSNSRQASSHKPRHDTGTSTTLGGTAHSTIPSLTGPTTGSLHVVQLTRCLWLAVLVSPDDTHNSTANGNTSTTSTNNNNNNNNSETKRLSRRKGRGASDGEIRAFLDDLAQELRPAAAFAACQGQARNESTQAPLLSVRMEQQTSQDEPVPYNQVAFLDAIKRKLGVRQEQKRDDWSASPKGMDYDGNAAAMFFLGPNLGTILLSNLHDTSSNR